MHRNNREKLIYLKGKMILFLVAVLHFVIGYVLFNDFKEISSFLMFWFGLMFFDITYDLLCFDVRRFLIIQINNKTK